MNSNRKFCTFILKTALKNDSFLSYNAAMNYKVVEISTVTDEEIERTLNEWTAKGYVFESIQFVTSVSSKRPTMAFLFFTKKNHCIEGFACMFLL